MRPTLHDASAALAEAEELRVRARRENDQRALAMAIKRQVRAELVAAAAAGDLEAARRLDQACELCADVPEPGNGLCAACLAHARREGA